MDISIRECTVRDLELLQQIGYDTFDETFRSLNTTETINAYLAEAFSREKLLSEMMSGSCSFYFMYCKNELIGYLKLNEALGQSDLNDPDSLEIERIYVRKEYKGQGLGKILIDYALKKAVESGKQYVWLGVWERNTTALAFYEKVGFKEMGKHSFRMGDELQTDYILKKMATEDKSEPR